MKSALLSVCMLFMIVFLPLAAAAKIGGGDVAYKPKGAARVLFQHEFHVNLKGLRCNSCHYKPFAMSTGHYQMDMSKLTKGEFCGSCHNGKNAFDLKAASNCSKCHKD